EVLVEREDDDREGGPGHEAQYGDPGHVVGEGGRVGVPEHRREVEVLSGEPDGEPGQEGERDRETEPPLRVVLDPVPGETGLEAYEVAYHEAPSTSPPTAAMKASSMSSLPVSLQRPSGVSSMTRRPPTMIPIRVHSFSTRCISWEEKMIVVPWAAASRSRFRMMRADTASTPSNGSSRKSTGGRWMIAAPRAIFFRMPRE